MVSNNQGGITMNEKKFDSKKIKKIIAYIVFVVITFTLSLLFMPFELFLLSTIVVLIALRGVEKEIGGFNLKRFKTLPAQPTKTKI